jgi:hypothetical protein
MFSSWTLSGVGCGVGVAVGVGVGDAVGVGVGDETVTVSLASPQCVEIALLAASPL